MRFDWLNLTFDNDLDGISTYGARPRSADWMTVSARPRIEPRVFLSFVELFGMAAANFVFFAMILLGRFGRFCFGGSRFRIDDQHILAKFLGRSFTLLRVAVQLRVRNGRLLLRNIHQPAIQI